MDSYDSNLADEIIKRNLFVKIDLQKWLDQPFYSSNPQDANDQLSTFDG